MTDIIKEKFNNAIEEEFGGFEHNGSLNLSNLSAIYHNYSNKYKVEGEDCKYNIINDNYFFNTGQYRISLDTGELKGGVLTMVIVPHRNLSVRVHGFNQSRKLKKQQRNANRRK